MAAIEVQRGLVVGGNESGKSTLCEGILAAFFAPPTSPDFFSWSHPEVCRVLLFFSTAEGRLHIVKDFVGHSADLAAWDPAQGTFVSMAQDPSHIAALLSKDLGGVILFWKREMDIKSKGSF